MEKALTAQATETIARRTIEVVVNGERHLTSAATLEALVAELDLAGVRVATALNGDFVPATARASRDVAAGDRIEIVSARQGG